MTTRTKTWLWSGAGAYLVVRSYQEFRTPSPTWFAPYAFLLWAGLAFYCAFWSYRNREIAAAEAMVPTTKLSRIGVGCLMAVLPIILYKVLHKVTGEPIDYTSRTAVILGGLAMFGWIFGLGSLGIATIRSAWRE